MALTTDKYLDLLQKHVSSAAEYTDLIPIFTHAGLQIDVLKNVLNSYLDGLAEAETRHIALNALPITDVLPVDMIQKIDSFEHHPDVTVVNKAMKSAYDQNQAILHRKRLELVEMQSFEPDVPFDSSTNQRWVVHPPGGEVSPQVMDIVGSEYIVHVCDNLSDLIATAQSGDQIFIQEGDYSFHPDPERMTIRKNFQIMGIGENVRILSSLRIGSRTEEPPNVFIKNIQFGSIGNHCDFMVLCGSKLWMEECTFTHNCHAYFWNAYMDDAQGASSEVHLKRCTIRRGFDILDGTCRFIGCVMENMQKPMSLQHPMADPEDPTSGSFIGNIFRNNQSISIPLSSLHAHQALFGRFECPQSKNDYTFEGNVFEGFNGDLQAVAAKNKTGL